MLKSDKFYQISKISNFPIFTFKLKTILFSHSLDYYYISSMLKSGLLHSTPLQKVSSSKLLRVDSFYFLFYSTRILYRFVARVFVIIASFTICMAIDRVSYISFTFSGGNHPLYPWNCITLRNALILF